MNKRSNLAVAALLLGATLTLSGFAFGSPAIPSRVRSHLDLDCTPKCTTCHDSAMAGRNNAGRPFAQSVLAVLDEKGLDITSSDAIEIALKQLDADGTDSDKDEISDIEELTSNPSSDPSVAGDAGVGQVCIDPEAEYGCGARVAGEAVQGRYAVPVAALLLAAFAFRARRRRTS